MSGMYLPVERMSATLQARGVVVFKCDAAGILEAEWPGVRCKSDAADKAGWYWDTACQFQSGPFPTAAAAMADAALHAKGPVL